MKVEDNAAKDVGEYRKLVECMRMDAIAAMDLKNALPEMFEAMEMTLPVEDRHDAKEAGVVATEAKDVLTRMIAVTLASARYIEKKFIESAEEKAVTPAEWIDKRDRMPTKEDEDRYGYILSWNVHDGVHVSSAVSFEKYGSVCFTHWARTPEAPAMDEEYLREVRAR